MNNIIVAENIMAFKELFMQIHALDFNKINKDNSIDAQNEGHAEIYGMKMDYQPTGTLNDALLKWKDIITETENVKSSKVIVKLQSTLRNRFRKSIIKEAKENHYITDNDLVQFIEYFKISVVIIKYYTNLKIQFKESKYFICDYNFNVTKKKDTMSIS